VLGEQVQQRGSRVGPQSLRFDFDHLRALTKDELRKVERLVNQKVRDDVAIITRQMPLADAKKLYGLRAFFGEKYGDMVRVVELEDGYSRELCGGTHLERTGQIGLCKIMAEESVAKGIRRITAVTAERACQELVRLEATLEEASELLKTSPERIAERITALQKQLKDLNSRLAGGSERSVKSFRDKLAANAVRIGSTAVVIAEAPANERPEWMRTTADWMRKEMDSVAVMLASKVGGKALLTAAMSEDLVKRGLSASEWISSTAKVLGGKGGGKAAMAQGGGPSPKNISLALKQAYQDIKARLGEST
jgi:alanyl-tRNA synthetase